MVFVLTAPLIPPLVFLFCIISVEYEKCVNNREKIRCNSVFVIMHK